VRKKETFTDVEVVKDIKNEIKDPERQSETQYQDSNFYIILAVIGLFALNIYLGIHFDEIFVWIWGCVPVFLLGLVFWYVLRDVWRVKRVRIENYEITTAILSDTADESHWEKQSAGRHSRRVWVPYHRFRFEKYGYWIVPVENYCWSKESPMGAWYVFENSHRGDEFIIVIEKKTRRVVVAYHTKFFEYKGERLTVLEENRNE
jgi:hypothetical protein